MIDFCASSPCYFDQVLFTQYYHNNPPNYCTLTIIFKLFLLFPFPSRVCPCSRDSRATAITDILGTAVRSIRTTARAIPVATEEAVKTWKTPSAVYAEMASLAQRMAIKSSICSLKYTTVTIFLLCGIVDVRRRRIFVRRVRALTEIVSQ